MTPLLLLPLLASPVLAQDDRVRVFVSEFQAADEDSAAIASLLRAYLQDELARHPRLETIPVEEAPPFDDTPAITYLRSCPPGDAVGCAFVVAERVRAEYGLAGFVRSAEDGSSIVEVTVIDVAASKEAITLKVGLDIGEDEVLAEGLAELLLAVAMGQAGQTVDIRDPSVVYEEEDPGATILANEEVARQLEELAREMGDFETLTATGDRQITVPKYTAEDLLRDATTDGATPWQELDMSAREYLRYKNSGLLLNDWRARAIGRKGQVVVRGAVGMMRGPNDAEFNGRYAIELVGFDWITTERYAYTSYLGATGFHGGAWLGFGVTPWLEVDVGAGASTGRYTLTISREQADNTPTNPEAQSRVQTNIWAGGRVIGVPLPTLRLRPQIMVGGAWRRSHQYTDFWEQHEEFQPLPAPWNLEVQLGGGGEVTLADRVDLALLVPIGVNVGGSPTQVYDENIGVLQQKPDPPTLSLFSAGVELSMAIRFFGAKPAEGRDLLFLDEPEDY